MKIRAELRGWLFVILSTVFLSNSPQNTLGNHHEIVVPAFNYLPFQFTAVRASASPFSAWQMLLF